MGASLSPTPASLVAAEFLSYLQIRKGLSVPGYLQAPEDVPDGWETYTYRLQLHGRNRLPSFLRRPLALRVYAGPEGLPRLRREWTMQSWLAEQGYPVARPVLMEEDPGFLGGPFLLMEWVEGERLLERLLRDYIALFWRRPHGRSSRPAARAAGARPARPGSAVSRTGTGDAPGRRGYAPFVRPGPGVNWLRAHRPPEVAPPCLLHLDFHAKNILTQPGRIAAVLDWSEADFGDRHADVGMALHMIDEAPVEDASWIDRVMLPLGRFLTHVRYLNVYRRRLPLERRRLRYYQAWAALRRLTWYGCWLSAGPHVMGYKPAAVRHAQRGHVAGLEHYFKRYSGVTVRLGLAAPETITSFRQ